MARKKGQKAPKKRTITRKIFFYRVNAGVNNDTGTPLEIDFGPTVRHIQHLPFTTEGRYLDGADGKQLCCWPDTSQAPYRIRLANIRRGQHPPVESEGEFSPLILGAGRGLAEITHLVLFPDGYCAAEFNFYGPRTSQLPTYFALKAKGLRIPFKLNPIVRPDLETRLAALTDIKLLDLKVRASYESTLKNADADLGSAFAATLKAVSARPDDEFELIFRRKRHKDGQPSSSVPSTLLAAIRALARRQDLRDNVSIFKVIGADGTPSSVVDILHEQFVAEREIEPASNESGGVNSESMFQAIESAFGEVQATLAQAKEIE